MATEHAPDPRLARQGYTAEEVDRFLRSSGLRSSARFDLLDTTTQATDPLLPTVGGFGKVGELTTVHREDGAAVVKVNGEQKISGTLNLAMQPDERLRDSEFKFAIRPVYLLQIPNGDVLEFNQGVYTHAGIDRGVLPRREDWELQMGDFTTWFDMAGPWWGGFGISAGSRYTDGLRTLFESQRVFDYSGIHPSEAVAASELIWGFNRWPDYTDGYYGTFWYWNGENALQVKTTTMLDVWIDVCAALSYYPPSCSRDGVCRAMPVRDVRTPEPVTTFGSATDGITHQDITSKDDRSKMANYVVVYSEGNKNENGDQGSDFIGTADADAYYPSHPFSQRNLGRYVPKATTSPWAVNPEAADAEAFRIMAASLTYAQTITYTSKPFPTLEVYDVNLVHVEGDAELHVPVPYIKVGYDFDLFADEMTHTDRRLVIEGGDLGYIDVGLTDPWNIANEVPT